MLFLCYECVTQFADLSREVCKTVKLSYLSVAVVFLSLVHLDTSCAEQTEDAGDCDDVSVILGLHLREEGLHCLRHTHTHTHTHTHINTHTYIVRLQQVNMRQQTNVQCSCDL